MPQIPIERHALDNGLRIILSRDPPAPMVAVNLWYDVGSIETLQEANRVFGELRKE